MKKISILHIIEDLEIGGSEMGLFKLVKSLDNNKFKSIVCTFNDGSVGGLIRNMGISVIQLNKKISWDFKLLVRLVRLIKKLNIDIVHCRGTRPIVYGGLAALLAKVPRVISLHGFNNIDDRWGLRLVKLMARSGARIVSVSNQLRDELCQRTGMKKEKVITIHNGIEINHRIEKADCIRIKKELVGLDSDSVVIGAVGSLRPVKGYEYLLNAVLPVTQSFSNIKFIIVGDGRSRPFLEKLADDLKIRDYVSFLGYRDDIAALIRVMDIVVVPSLSEGISNVILEAMAASKPVIATRVGGNPEVVTEDGTAFLIPPKDPASIAHAIITLLKDENTREEMGKAAFDRVRKLFAQEIATRKYEELYSSML